MLLKAAVAHRVFLGMTANEVTLRVALRRENLSVRVIELGLPVKWLAPASNLIYTYKNSTGVYKIDPTHGVLHAYPSNR